MWSIKMLTKPDLFSSKSCNFSTADYFHFMTSCPTTQENHSIIVYILALQLLKTCTQIPQIALITPYAENVLQKYNWLTSFDVSLLEQPGVHVP